MINLRRIHHSAPLLFVLALLFACACEAGRTASARARRFELRGRIVSFDKGRRQVIISHEDVPGLMEGMTMSFALEEGSAYDVMKVGSGVRATLVVDEGKSWLENPVITEEAAETAGRESTGSQPAEPREGDALPPVKLLNQSGRRAGIEAYRGRVLAVTFIYTRCPLPDYCALMSAKFAQINRALRESPTLAGKAHLLSVSLDPENDTPKVLRSYGAAYTENYSSEKFDTWEFATGDPNEVRRLAGFFGLAYDRQGGQIVHSLRTAVVTPDGKLYKIYRGNEWKPEDVLNDIRVLAGENSDSR